MNERNARGTTATVNKADKQSREKQEGEEVLGMAIEEREVRKSIARETPDETTRKKAKTEETQQ
jgi:hypothetical protein